MKTDLELLKAIYDLWCDHHKFASQHETFGELMDQLVVVIETEANDLRDEQYVCELFSRQDGDERFEAASVDVLARNIVSRSPIWNHIDPERLSRVKKYGLCEEERLEFERAFGEATRRREQQREVERVRDRVSALRFELATSRKHLSEAGVKAMQEVIADLDAQLAKAVTK